MIAAPAAPRGVSGGRPCDADALHNHISVQVTGSAQKLGQLEAVHRDLKSKSSANLKRIGRPYNVYAIGGDGGACRLRRAAGGGGRGGPLRSRMRSPPRRRRRSHSGGRPSEDFFVLLVDKESELAVDLFVKILNIRRVMIVSARIPR